MREEIKNLLEKSLKELQKEKIFPKFNIPEIQIEHPEEKAHGDYATNVAMVITKQIKKNPLEIANILGSRLKVLGDRLFEKIEVAEPGFINFFLSKECLQKEVGEILKRKEKFGQLKIGKGKKVNIEFCSANPTGPLHLGHGRGAFWGDTLANVLNKAGHKVTREYFINDYGKQILLLGESINARYRELLGQKVEIKEEFYKGEYIKDVAKEIVEKEGDKYLKMEEGSRVKILTEIGIKKMLEEAKKLLEKVGAKYDVWFSERSLYKKDLVKKGIELLKKKGFTYEKEGALWFASTKFGDDKDRVLFRADGEPTYFASDVAYHLDKVSRGYDLMINGWGADHWGYKTRLMAAAKVLGFDKKLKIIVGQFVRLVENGKEIKMSKRGGTFVALEDLISEVGPDVARFFFLMKSVDTHIDFNSDLAKEQSEKNPVYYIQYAHARICSILRKCKMQKSKCKITIKNLKLLTHPNELELIRQLIRFPEIVEDTAKDYQIQRIPQYALDLATVFHQFYRDCRVLRSPEGAKEDRVGEELSNARLALVLATKTVLKNTLNLMGISAPEKM